MCCVDAGLFVCAFFAAKNRAIIALTTFALHLHVLKRHFGRHSASSLTRQPRKAYNNFLLAARESDPDAEIDDTQDSQESSKDVDNPKTSRRWSQRERRKEHARKVRELQKQRLSREPKALFMLVSDFAATLFLVRPKVLIECQ